MTLDREVRVVAGIITVVAPDNTDWTIAPDVGGDVVAVLQQLGPDYPALRPRVLLSEVKEEILVVPVFHIDGVRVVGNLLAGEGVDAEGGALPVRQQGGGGEEDLSAARGHQGRRGHVLAGGHAGQHQDPASQQHSHCSESSLLRLC